MRMPRLITTIQYWRFSIVNVHAEISKQQNIFNRESVTLILQGLMVPLVEAAAKHRTLTITVLQI